jgi:hypothetical protein
MKLSLEIIYKSNQTPSKVGLGLDRHSVLIKREAQALLFLHPTGCLKSEAQVHIFKTSD